MSWLDVADDYGRRYIVRIIRYKVKNPQGIHAGPAALLANQFSQFKCDVIIKKDQNAVNAKRIFALMSLNIKQGDTITIVFEGEDEKAASKAAEKFLKDNL